MALTTEPALCRLTLPSGALRKLPLPAVAVGSDLRLARLDAAHLALGKPEGHLLQFCVTDPSGELGAIAARRPGARMLGSHYAATVSPEPQRVLVVREPTTLAPREVWRCDLEEGWRGPELRRGFALTADGRHIVTDDGLYRLP